MINKKGIYKFLIFSVLATLCTSNVFIIKKINEISKDPIGIEQFSTIGTMYEVVKNVGRKDNVLFDNIDNINISFKGKVLNVEKPDMDTIRLIVDDKPYTVVDKERLNQLKNRDDNFLEKDYFLIEGLMFSFYKLEAEEAKGSDIDTSDTPCILEYIEPITETLQEKYVILKIHSDYYKEVSYKLNINEMGIIINEI